MSPLHRLRAIFVQAAERLGRYGVVGLGLIAFAVGFYYSTVRPQRLELVAQRKLLSQLERQRVSVPVEAPRSTRERLAAFFGLFPPSDETAELLRKVYAAAEAQGLVLEQGEYRVVKDSRGKLIRYRIVLPVKGSYPQVRKFVGAALEAMPSLSLDGIQFERPKVGDPALEARVRLELFLGARP